MSELISGKNRSLGSAASLIVRHQWCEQRHAFGCYQSFSLLKVDVRQYQGTMCNDAKHTVLRFYYYGRYIVMIMMSQRDPYLLEAKALAKEAVDIVFAP